MIRRIRKVLGVVLTLQLVYSKQNTPKEDSIQNNDIQNFIQHSVDRLCAVTNIIDQVCVIKDKSLRFTYDLFYETQLSLEFINTVVRCLTPDYMPCTIQIKQNGAEGQKVTLRNGTQFYGKQVIIESQNGAIQILDTSIVSVSGQSFYQHGTSGQVQAGASFIGQGGQCFQTATTQNQTYGYFDMLPQDKDLKNATFQIGSIGKIGDAETGGGGRILIISDSLLIQGDGVKLEANALPTQNYKGNYGLQGGSGGYIYVKTTNNFKQNSFGQSFRIEATGGFGFGGYSGGSGGVIVLDGGVSISPTQVNAQGGTSDLYSDGCQNGAAGTIWFSSTDKLIVDNKSSNSTRVTKLVKQNTTNFHEENFQSQSKLVSNLIIKGNAKVQITTKCSDLKFNELQMVGPVLFYLKNSYPNLHLTLNQANIDKESTLNFSSIENISLTQTSQTKKLVLGTLIYKSSLNITTDDLYIGGSFVTQDEQQNSTIIVNVKSLELGQKVKIKAGKVLLHAFKEIKSQAGATVESYQTTSCTEYSSSNQSLFNCVPVKSLDLDLSPKTFLLAFGDNPTSPVDYFAKVTPTLIQNFSIYIFSFGTINLTETSIKAAKVGLCGQNIVMQKSVVDSSGQGCASSTGLGKGLGSALCAGSGASHGGYGGAGAAYSKNQQNFCQNNVPRPYFSEGTAKYEGSGGASGTLNGGLGGSGGGIIWISTMGNLTLNNTKLFSKGLNGKVSQNGQAGSGGGAGGSIQIVTNQIEGNGEINVQGGDGSFGGGGGGSGGRLIVTFLKNYIAENQKLKSHEWNGTFINSGGQPGFLSSHENSDQFLGNKGQDGTSSQTSCFGGYSGPFCEPCPIGTYKYNYGTAPCLACENKPENSFYYKIAVQQAICPYQCNNDFETADTNPLCLTSIEIQSTQMGGVIVSLEIAAGLVTLVLTSWIMLSAWSKHLRRSSEKQIDSIGVKVTKPSMIDQIRILSEQDLKLTVFETQHQFQRMYFIGQNSVHFPWVIPQDFKNDSLSEEGRSTLKKFIQQEQQILLWTSFEKQMALIVSVCAPLFSNSVNRHFRKKHFQLLQKRIVQKFGQEYWLSFWQNQVGLRIRLTTDQNYQSCFMDFLDYGKNKKRELPLVLILSGDGNLSTPYCIDTTDSLSLGLIHINPEILTKQLQLFYQNLNTQLNQLCFLKFQQQTMKDFKNILDWIDLANKSLFHSLKIHITLWLFENSMIEAPYQTFKQRRRSMPIETAYLEAFPQVYKRLISFINNKLYREKSEVKLGLVFSTYDKQKEMEIEDRIKTALEYQFSDGEMCSISLIHFGQPHLEYSPDSDDVIEQGPQEEDYENKLKAFELSYTSTSLFDRALNKKKVMCSYISLFYSFWLMLFRFQASPATSNENAQLFFILYSIVNAVDILLTGIMTMHCFNPASNAKSFGIPFLFILPGIAIIAPFIGLFASIFGNPNIMRFYSDMNATFVAITYPLQIVFMIFLRTPKFYFAILIAMVLNKVLLSFLGAVVRAHLINPTYVKNYSKLRTWNRLYKSVTDDLEFCDIDLFTEALKSSQKGQQFTPPRRFDSENSSSFESSEDSGEENVFGIIPIKQLKEQLIIQEKFEV